MVDVQTSAGSELGSAADGRPECPRIEGVRKIAVLRPNAVGDFVFCLPALHALRACYPEAQISYLGKAWHADFLRDRPGPVDRVVVMPDFPGVGAPAAMMNSPVETAGHGEASQRRGGASAPAKPQTGTQRATLPTDRRGSPDSAGRVSEHPAAAHNLVSRRVLRGAAHNAGQHATHQSTNLYKPASASAGSTPVDYERENFIAAARAEHYDLAIQLYGGGQFANPLLQQLGARICVGMRARNAAPLDRWLFAGTAPVNKRLQLLEVAALAGASSWPMDARLQLIARDHAEAATCFPPETGEQLVLLQPGSSDPRRCWPAVRFAALGDALAERGARIVVNGSASEAALVDDVIASMRHSAIGLAGRASLNALCGLLHRAALIVSNDTGPLHLALELGTPAVGLYWFTNAIESAPLSLSRHRAAVSLQIHCPTCGEQNISQRCAHDPSFLQDISTEKVIALAESLLAPS